MNVNSHLPAEAAHDVEDVGEHGQEGRHARDKVETTLTGERGRRAGHEACLSAGGMGRRDSSPGLTVATRATTTHSAAPSRTFHVNCP
jgi:hypothetical protein